MGCVSVVRAYGLRSPSSGLVGHRFSFGRSCRGCLFLLVDSCVDLLPCYDLRLRGLFGRSFLCATVPLPVPSWTPADSGLRPRSGLFRPTPIKSMRSSRGTPRRSTISFTPGRNGQVHGTHRAGGGPQGFARRQAANQHRHKGRKVSPFSGLKMLHFSNLTQRIGQRWEPTRAPRQGSKRNEGGPDGSPLFFALCRHSSLSFMR
jgi:hypothetical protein